MRSFPSVGIGELVAPVESWTPERDDPDGAFTYIDLSAVNQDTKAITGARQLACADAPSRARQLVQADDVLVSTVRPNLNAVARVPQVLDGATASTGFCVVRARAEKLDGGYLFQWVRSPPFVSDMVRMATGASYPAVSDRIVLNSKLPLPPLPEQRRIAEILDKADALRAKRRAALAQLDALTQSIFLDMFGDPVTNPKRWAREVIGEIAEQVTDGEHLTPRRTREGIKLLSARNIRDGYLDFVNVDYIDADEYERISRRCDPVAGDVLISCSGTIGRVASVETTEKFSLVRSAALVRPNRDRIAHKFLEHYLRTPAMKARMLLRANASSQANLFQGQIREFPVYLPPLRLQIEFADRAASIGRLRNHERGSLSEIDALFASLQHRAFRGDL